MPALDAGAIDEDADLVAVGEDLGGEGRDLLLDSHVGRVNPGFAAELLNSFLCLGDTRVTLAIIKH